MKFKKNDEVPQEGEIKTEEPVKNEECPIKKDIDKLKEIAQIQINLAKSTLESAERTLNDLFTLLDEGND